MVNMSAKYDQEAHNSLVAIVFTRLFPYISILTLTIYLRNQLGSSSAKFDQEAQKGVIAIVFTSLFPYMSIVTLTFYSLFGPKNTNLVEDVKILLPVKFRWILFSTFRGKVQICLS